MSRHRTHRKDGTSDAIVKALRARGADVWPIGRPCDLLVRFGEKYFLIDCDGVTKNRKRDPAQLENFRIWGVKLCKTPDEALRAIGAIVPIAGFSPPGTFSDMQYFKVTLP